MMPAALASRAQVHRRHRNCYVSFAGASIAMLVPIILPMQITFCVMVAIIAICLLLAARWKWNRWRMFERAVFCMVLLYIPSCMGVMAVIDPLRYGTFHYATAAAAGSIDLPASATDIELHRQSTGFHAKYRVEQREVREFIEHQWATGGKDQPRQDKPTDDVYRDWFAPDGWAVPPNAELMQGPRSSDGGGTILYYDPPTRTAYQSTAFW